MYVQVARPGVPTPEVPPAVRRGPCPPGPWPRPPPRDRGWPLEPEVLVRLAWRTAQLGLCGQRAASNERAWRCGTGGAGAARGSRAAHQRLAASRALCPCPARLQRERDGGPDVERQARLRPRLTRRKGAPAPPLAAGTLGRAARHLRAATWTHGGRTTVACGGRAARLQRAEDSWLLRLLSSPALQVHISFCTS